MPARVVYAVVGLAGLWGLMLLFRPADTAAPVVHAAGSPSQHRS
jgi:uncharacterized membrane protein YuzA (DUF378 family)